MKMWDALFCAALSAFCFVDVIFAVPPNNSVWNYSDCRRMPSNFISVNWHFLLLIIMQRSIQHFCNYSTHLLVRNINVFSSNKLSSSMHWLIFICYNTLFSESGRWLKRDESHQCYTDVYTQGSVLVGRWSTNMFSNCQFTKNFYNFLIYELLCVYTASWRGNLVCLILIQSRRWQIIYCFEWLSWIQQQCSLSLYYYWLCYSICHFNVHKVNSQ